MNCLGDRNGKVVRLQQVDQALVWKLKTKQDVREGIGWIAEEKLRGTWRECVPNGPLVKQPTEENKSLRAKEECGEEENGTTEPAEDLILLVVRLWRRRLRH